MANPGQSTVQSDAKGDAVLALQRALKRTRQFDAVLLDGVFGPDTEAKVKQFQANAHLAVDGLVGPATWSRLPFGGPMPQLETGSKGAVVSRLQAVLSDIADAGHAPSPGAADGEFGPRTEAAVEGLQRWQHLPVDGVVGEATWAASINTTGGTLESVFGLGYAAGAPPAPHPPPPRPPAPALPTPDATHADQ